MTVGDQRRVAVPEGLDGERLDAALARMFGLSRAAAADLISGGQVLVAGRPAVKSDRVPAGEWLDVTLPPPPSAAAPVPQPVPGLAIVYEDADIVVVDKPVGVAAHPTPGRTRPAVPEGLLAAPPPLGGVARLPHEADALPADAVQVAVIGRPNVGKSSLTNRLLGEERSVVAPSPGTTRDAVDSPLRYHGRTLNFIDTAGLRRRPKVVDEIEFYSSLRTERAIEHAHVCVLVVDAALGMHAQDLRIAEQVWEQGAGLIIAVNKWDLVTEKDTATARRGEQAVLERMPALAAAPVVFVSALTGQRVPGRGQDHQGIAHERLGRHVDVVGRLAQDVQVVQALAQAGQDLFPVGDPQRDVDARIEMGKLAQQAGREVGGGGDGGQGQPALFQAPAFGHVRIGLDAHGRLAVDHPGDPPAPLGDGDQDVHGIGGGAADRSDLALHLLDLCRDGRDLSRRQTTAGLFPRPEPHRAGVPGDGSPPRQPPPRAM